MDRRDLPVGIFDSGLGGVSVLRECVKLLPHEDFIYYGDDLNAPYGTRSEDEIRELSLACADFLTDRGCKLIVVACNTATSVAIQMIRDKHAMEVVSMEPAVKPACETYPAGAIAVFATPATLHQKRYRRLIERLGIQDRVRDIACTDLAGLIENGDLQAPQVRAYIRDRMAELKNESAVNALVIGCTHYTFVSRIIEEEAKARLPGACEVFDGVYGTARRVRQLLERDDLMAQRERIGDVEYYSSGGALAVQTMEQFFAMPMEP